IRIIEILEPHGKVNLVGKSFGVIKFKIQDRTYDIALPRIDRSTTSKNRGHKDFIIDTDPDLPLETDLSRRDFRCNSIALRLKDGSLIDPLDGVSDIKKRIIRLTNPHAYPEDPLRVLRAARFASVLGFTVDKPVYVASKKIDLSGLSMERVTEELYRILLLSPLPSVGLEELFKLNVLKQLFPELYRLTLCIQDSVFHPEQDNFGHHTVWQHSKISVDQAKKLASEFSLPAEEKLALLLASLFHDVGKSRTTHWEFKKERMVITSNGHDIASAQITEEAFERLKIFTLNGYNLRKIIPRLIRCHHRASELWANRKVLTKKAFNRLAADIDGNIELLVLLDAADRAGRSEEPVKGLDREGIWLLDQFHELNISKETIKPMILGRDLLDMGMESGPDMGKALKTLYQLQLDLEFETKEDGIKAARNLLRRGNK
ncbi:HD domain-containing protein, partial [Acidobacteriota bacterium]